MLAMLYVQNQDLSGLSPEELFDKYKEAYDKIKIHSRKPHDEYRSTGWGIK